MVGLISGRDGFHADGGFHRGLQGQAGIGHGFEGGFEFWVGNDGIAGLDGGRLTFNVGQDSRNFGHLIAHFCFKTSYFVMRVLHAQLLIKFQMLLDMKPAVQILHAHVMDAQVVLRRDRANAIEDALMARSTGNRPHNHIRIRQHNATRLV